MVSTHQGHGLLSLPFMVREASTLSVGQTTFSLGSLPSYLSCPTDLHRAFCQVEDSDL